MGEGGWFGCLCVLLCCVGRVFVRVLLSNPDQLQCLSALCLLARSIVRFPLCACSLCLCDIRCAIRVGRFCTSWLVGCLVT